MGGLGDQCQRLQGVISTVVEGLAQVPAEMRSTYGQRIADVRQGLTQLQTANASLLDRAGPFDNGSIPAPLDVLKGVDMVVANCSEVVEALQGAILLDITPHKRAVDTGRMALTVAVRGLDIATSLAAAEKSGESPPYATTSISDEILAIKSRLAEDRDRDINGLQIVALSEFLDCLQRYAASQAGMLSPLAMSNLAISDASRPGPSNPIMGEELSRASTTIEDSYLPGHPIPAYSAVDIPAAPQRIHLRHISRLPGLEFEPVDVVFDTQSAVLRVAIADLYSRVRFFNVRGSPSNKPAEDLATLSSQLGTTGQHLTLSRTGQARLAVVTDGPIGPDPGENQHDGEHFHKPVLNIYNYVQGSRVAQIKRSGVRPFAFSPDGAYLAVRGPRGRVEIVSGTNGKGVAVVRSHTDEVVNAQFTSDGSALVTMSRDGTLRVTSTATWQGISKLEVAEWRNPVFLALPLTPSNVIMSVWGRKVYLWNPDTGALDKWDLDRCDENTGTTANEGWPLAASPNLKYLCCRTEQGADVREVASGRVLCRLGFGAGFATAAGWSADSRILALGRMVGGVLGVGTGRVDFWEVID